MKNNKYGGYNTKTPEEKIARLAEKIDNTRNGPVTITPPDINTCTITQYMNWLMTLSPENLQAHLDADPNKPASTRKAA
jgi:hypothetical protein